MHFILLHLHVLSDITSICSGNQCSNVPHAQANSGTIKLLLGIFFGIIGALAFLMITISGLRYVLSDGDPQKTKEAREGIIYALVGLLVAVSAEGIINFVIGSI